LNKKNVARPRRLKKQPIDEAPSNTFLPTLSMKMFEIRVDTSITKDRIIESMLGEMKDPELLKIVTF